MYWHDSVPHINSMAILRLEMRIFRLLFSFESILSQCFPNKIIFLGPKVWLNAYNCCKSDLNVSFDLLQQFWRTIIACFLYYNTTTLVTDLCSVKRMMHQTKISTRFTSDKWNLFNLYTPQKILQNITIHFRFPHAKIEPNEKNSN